MTTSRSKILFFITGSIAAFKAAQVVSRLIQLGHEVQCVATSSALRFVGEATFEGLTARRVLTDLWEPGRAMDHIHISRWADFGVICPASANTISRLALGLGEDLVGNTLLAWPATKPLYVFPAMNREMLSSPPVLQHIAQLRARGIFVAETGAGSLACGETGEGRLLEPEEIVAILTQRSPHGRILITAGATRESIDGIRFITNHSTGRTGAELAEELKRAGWSVTYLCGQGAIQPRDADKVTVFSDYKDLKEKVHAELAAEDYTAVIHCAAVSDFTVGRLLQADNLGVETKAGDSSSKTKAVELKSSSVDSSRKIMSGQKMTLELEPTAKILNSLKEFSRNKNISVVGFKLTLNASESEMKAAAHGILSEQVDAVVANDWSRVVADRTRHPGVICARNSEQPFTDVPQLATLLAQMFTKTEKTL